VENNDETGTLDLGGFWEVHMFALVFFDFEYESTYALCGKRTKSCFRASGNTALGSASSCPAYNSTLFSCLESCDENGSSY
jgi:hypothetical protein